MHSIPPYLLVIGAFLAWIGLMLSWSRYIREVSENRRNEAVANGEEPPDIRGVSNYERADLRESAHRDSKVSAQERWIGRGVGFGIPAIIFIVFIARLPL